MTTNAPDSPIEFLRDTAITLVMQILSDSLPMHAPITIDLDEAANEVLRRAAAAHVDIGIPHVDAHNDVRARIRSLLEIVNAELERRADS